MRGARKCLRAKAVLEFAGDYGSALRDAAALVSLATKANAPRQR